MSELGAAYVPSKWGREFHALPHHEALGAGSAGPGKTQVLIFEPLAQISVEHARCQLPKEHPHRLGWGQSSGWALYLRRTYKQLEQTIDRCQKLFPQIDSGVEWQESKMRFRFSSGYSYEMGHCHNEKDSDNYFSKEFTSINFDELTQFLESQYTVIKSRLRSSDPVLRKMLKVRSMSNPVTRHDGEHFAVDDPFWVRRYFVDPFPQGRKTLVKKMKRRDGSIAERTRIYLPAKLTDNPDAEFVANYEETLLDMPLHLRRALIDGDWYVTAGAHYSEYWLSDIHVCQPFKIPPGWRWARSMDWGFKAPGCIHWWAINDDGVAFAVRELTFRGKKADEVARLVRDIEREYGLWSTSVGDSGRSLITGPADTQLWEERGDTGKSKADIMAEIGVGWQKADKKSRRSNAQRFIDRLKDHNNGTTDPGIVFFSSCKNALRTIPGIQTDPGDPECPMDGGEDHWHDSVLYFCAYESLERAQVPSSEDDESEDDYSPGPGGQWGYGSA